MKIIRVQYTTSKEYASTNISNIKKVVAELKALNHPGIKYSCYLMEDGKTFMHLDQCDNEEAHQVIIGLDSFKHFSQELLASDLEKKPVLELPQLVGSTDSFFQN